MGLRLYIISRIDYASQPGLSNFAAAPRRISPAYKNQRAGEGAEVTNAGTNENHAP